MSSPLSSSHPSHVDAQVALDRVSYALPGGRPLFTNLSLGFGRGRTALVGPNGSGKTTLARLLVGELAPAAGRVVRRGRVAYVPQHPGDGPGRTLGDALGLAAVLDALARVEAGLGTAADVERIGADWDVRERAAAALARVGLAHLSPERPLARVSGGEATRAAIAGALLAEPDVLVLDEPTNHLDAEGRAAVLDLVRRWTRGLVVIGHDRALLRLVDRVVELSPLGVHEHGGGYDAWRAWREAEDAAAARELGAAERELRRVRREAQAARERQARRDAQGRRERGTGSQPKLVLNAGRERSEATGAQLAARTERLADDARARVAAARARVDVRERLAVALPATGLRAGRRVLEARDLRYTHPGAAAPTLDGVSLAIVGPERVALTGPNGSGKTTLLRLLAGELAPDAGAVRLGVDRDEVAYVDQRAAALRPEWSVLENCRAANPRLTDHECRAALARFLFRGDAALVPVGALSGGERVRAALACALNAARPPALLLLDEPTNHLDLDGVAAVEAALREYDGALVVVSHDADFLSAIGVQRSVTLRRAGGARGAPAHTRSGTTGEENGSHG